MKKYTLPTHQWHFDLDYPTKSKHRYWENFTDHNESIDDDDPFEIDNWGSHTREVKELYKDTKYGEIELYNYELVFYTEKQMMLFLLRWG